jgi:hypothetical protein
VSVERLGLLVNQSSSVNENENRFHLKINEPSLQRSSSRSACWLPNQELRPGYPRSEDTAAQLLRF